MLCYQICIHSKSGGELLHPNPASCVPCTKNVNLSSTCGEKRTAMRKIFFKFSSEVLGTYHQFLAKPVPRTDGKMLLHQYWYSCCAKNMSQQLVLRIEYGKWRSHQSSSVVVRVFSAAVHICQSICLPSGRAEITIFSAGGSSGCRNRS